MSIRAGHLIIVGWMLCAGGALAAETLDKPAAETLFRDQVWPVLAERCVGCHGPDVQEGRLRVDARAIVAHGGLSGPAVRAGRPDESPLLLRLLSDAEGPRMPLDDEPLPDDQVAAIRRWIAAGAPWPAEVGVDVAPPAPHWAFVPPRRPPLPAVGDTAWGANPIDRFILARLEAEQLRPSPPADRERLLRRATLDLTGLPPTLDELDAFLADDSPDAYERAVDRLLASPQWGPRWARPWLDLARYADTNGYQADQYREVWPFRDWVITALNADTPYDRFTIEQLAGDLLPDAPLAAKIASGFHRLTTCNVEAGVDPEENRVNQVVDRVNTTAAVWLGLTLNCAQCHHHKYDPFTQADYYRLFAYFNNTPLEVEGNGVQFEFVGPKLELPLAPELAARQRQLTDEAAAIDREFRQRLDAVLAERLAGEPAAPADIVRLAKLAPRQRKPADEAKLVEFCAQYAPELKEMDQQRQTLRRQHDAIQPTTTLVMVEDQPRATHILLRGDFLTPGRSVTPGTPQVFASEENQENVEPNRLGLAQWLVARDNPLTARVAVNRWWLELMGQGLVATPEDFGSQGDLPTHPELLDWLAVELVESGWSMKHVVRLLVTSETYRQSSAVTPELLAHDPGNKLYARGARHRLSAETIRDHALAAGGVLSLTMGGPPVYPPQPAGLWRHVGRNAPKYTVSTGDERFRRGVYVVWRRSAPPPSFTNFDAPDRAECTVRRSVTNTPLQALTLLNDEQYIELAWALAERVLRETPGGDDATRLERAFRMATSRRPTAEELAWLQAGLAEDRQRLGKVPPQVARLTKGRPTVAGVPPWELAAWFYTANVLLNLDETISKN